MKLLTHGIVRRCPAKRRFESFKSCVDDRAAGGSICGFYVSGRNRTTSYCVRLYSEIIINI